MKAKVREIRQQMVEMTEQIRQLMGDNKLDEAESKTKELRDLQRKLDIEEALEDVPEAVPPVVRSNADEEERKQPSVNKRELILSAMANQLRRHKMTEEQSNAYQEARAAMKAGEDADGGFIVPKDIQTTINELKRELNPLESLVNVVTATKMSGTRVLEKVSEMTPFAKVKELAQIGETDNPKFDQISYVINKYAGILPISKELLSDTDQNLMDYIFNWLAKKDVITRNYYIIEIMKTFAKKPVTNVDGLKDILNVELDPSISLMANIVTNQDGFNFLDKLKDNDGRYLLQTNPLNPTQKMLLARPVVVVSNKHLKTETSKAPIVVGALKEAITLFDRQLLTLEGTGVGGDSFKRDSYDVKAITRFDVKGFDTAAAVYGELTIA